MTKLWKKTEDKLNPAVEKYTAGTDSVFDMELMPFDIEASRAHAKGLEKIGVLSDAELKEILGGLDALTQDFKAGKIKITPADEDCHTVIENYLTEKIGDTGGKLHTGRSRNDQVATAVRLYMKRHLADLRTSCVGLSEQFLNSAEKYRNVPMPGFSHTQQAMLSSLGHYFLAFTESLLDDAEFMSLAGKHIDKNPLGSAAGFGTSIPVDREFTARELGFAGVQVNSLYCQNSRGKFESIFMESLAQVMLTLGKFANDMLIFTSQEFDYFSVDESLTTGSSIMPHKHNLDVMEILRGNVSVVIANQLMVKDISKNLISGYNRDGQLMKKPIFESAKIVAESLEVAGLVLAGIAPKHESISGKITPGIFTADIANKLVTEKDIPFRDAYKQAAGMISERPMGLASAPVDGQVDLAANIASKVSLGAPGNLNLEGYRKRIKKLTA
ncbi:MAG: argininosuccinate lyase [bacterium]|nr:argininosuccinate lyase [bacterium]